MKGVGVVFDIDALGGGLYGYEAWRIFMRALRPEKILGCRLREGDTSETLNGHRREFCIAVYGAGSDVDAVKQAFEASSEKGLAEPCRRFIVGARLESEPLADAGAIDTAGRLVQDSWTRFVHDECKAGGWGYAPRRVTVELSPELTAELEALRNMKVGSLSGADAGEPKAPADERTQRVKCDRCGKEDGSLVRQGYVFGQEVSRDQVRGPHWEGGVMVRDWRVTYGKCEHVSASICGRCAAAAARRARIGAALLLVPGIGLLLAGVVSRVAASGVGYAGTGLMGGGAWLLFFGWVFGTIARRRAGLPRLLLAIARHKIWKSGGAEPPHHWTLEEFQKLSAHQ